jgi:hypothetical protein
MLYFTPKYPAYGSWIGIVPVCGHLCRSVTNYLTGLREELLGCLHIPVLREHGINQVAVPVYGPVQVAPFAIDLDVGLVDVPGETGNRP